MEMFGSQVTIAKKTYPIKPKQKSKRKRNKQIMNQLILWTMIVIVRKSKYKRKTKNKYKLKSLLLLYKPRSKDRRNLVKLKQIAIKIAKMTKKMNLVTAGAI